MNKVKKVFAALLAVSMISCLPLAAKADVGFGVEFEIIYYLGTDAHQDPAEMIGILTEWETYFHSLISSGALVISVQNPVGEVQDFVIDKVYPEDASAQDQWLLSNGADKPDYVAILATENIF